MFGTICVSQKKKMKLLKVYLKTEHNYCNRPIYPHYLWSFRTVSCKAEHKAAFRDVPKKIFRTLSKIHSEMYQWKHIQNTDP